MAAICMRGVEADDFQVVLVPTVLTRVSLKKGGAGEVADVAEDLTTNNIITAPVTMRVPAMIL